MHVVAHTAVAVQVGIHIFSCLRRTHADILSQRKCRNPVDNAEINRLGTAAQRVADLFNRHIENFGRRDGMEVLAGEKGLLHGAVAGDVRQEAELNLAVVGVHQHFAVRCGKHGADLSAEFLAHRNVLKVRLGRRESSGRRHGHLKTGMDPPVRGDDLQEAVGIGALEFRQCPVIQHLPDDGMLVTQFLQYIDIGTPACFGLLAGRKHQFFKQDLPQLPGGKNVKVMPGESVDFLLQLRDAAVQRLTESRQRLPVHQKACFFHFGKYPAERHLNLFKEHGHLLLRELFLQNRRQGCHRCGAVNLAVQVALA